MLIGPDPVVLMGPEPIFDDRTGVQFCWLLDQSPFMLVGPEPNSLWDSLGPVGLLSVLYVIISIPTTKFLEEVTC